MHRGITCLSLGLASLLATSSLASTPFDLPVEIYIIRSLEPAGSEALELSCAAKAKRCEVRRLKNQRVVSKSTATPEKADAITSRFFGILPEGRIRSTNAALGARPRPTGNLTWRVRRGTILVEGSMSERDKRTEGQKIELRELMRLEASLSTLAGR